MPNTDSLADSADNARELPEKKDEFTIMRTLRLEVEAKASHEGLVAIHWSPARPAQAVDAAVLALSRANAFSRGGRLVELVQDSSPRNGKTRPDCNPRANDLRDVRLWEMISEQALVWEYAHRQGSVTSIKRIAVPDQLVRAVAARGQWEHVRPLVALAEYPTLRPDGTIMQAVGYDAATGLYATKSFAVETPERPSREDARAALATLEGLLSDFNFAKPANRAAWIACLLTLVARPAIDGPAPLTLIDAPAPGSGKTLLGMLPIYILTGSRPSPMTVPHGGNAEDEWRKRLLSVARSASPFELLDNITGELRSFALDAALSSGLVKDRVLGGSVVEQVPFRAVTVATSNGAVVSRDLVRRSMHVRIDPRCEKPAARPDSAFKFPGDTLLKHAHEHRALYLGAAFTILRAYVCAGRPAVEMSGVGSFDAWSRLVRAALVWAGADDPVSTQSDLQEMADADTDVVLDLMRAWHAAFKGEPRTAGDAVATLNEGLANALRAFTETTGDRMPTARGLGKRLARHRDCIAGGLVLTASHDPVRNVKVFAVRPVEQASAA
jgi:putative DNA primase/helicase